MFRHYPYRGWLLLSLLLWALASYRYYVHREELQPDRMAHMAGNDFLKRQNTLASLLKDKKTIREIFAGELTDHEEQRLEDLPFYFFAYSKDSLIFWNTNEISAANMQIGKPARLYRTAGGSMYREQYALPNPADTNQKLVVLLPILFHYPLENDYLKSHFAAGDYIPVGTEVLDKPGTETIAIKDTQGKPAFYLRFHKQEIPRWTPDGLLLWMVIAAILASVSWIQLMTIYLTRNRAYTVGVIVTLTVVIVLRVLLYIYGLPFNIETLTVFSPRLYASSSLQPSLGDLLINTLGFLWIVIFITRHTPYKTFFSRIQSARLKYIASGFFVLSITCYTFFFVHIIRGLVLDSSISFDVSHFYAINAYTILGLLTVGIITGVSCLVIFILNTEINNLVGKRWLKYLAIALIGTCIVLYLKKDSDDFPFFILGWLLLFIAVLDIRSFTLVSDLFSPHMVFWAIFICAFSTGLIEYFNGLKETDARKVFAEQRVAPDRDGYTELLFDKIAQNIERDKVINTFLEKPVAANRKNINERFDALYLGGQLNRYQSRIHLFDRSGHSLFNKDSVGYNALMSEVNDSAIMVSSTLFYKTVLPDGHYYIAYLPLHNDSTNKISGYAFINLTPKKAANETVYPELLQPTSLKTSSSEKEYAYAIYLNNKLVSQTNDYEFPVYLQQDSTLRQYSIHERQNYSELWYRYNNRKTVVVVHRHNLLFETITIFSYMFGIEILLAVIILLYQLYISYFINPHFTGRFVTLTLRRRIHLAMLSVVLVSFLIIGFVTIVFFVKEYQSSNRNKLEDAMQVVQQSVQQYLKQENAFAREARFDVVSRSQRFKNFITNLASSEKIDINIFNEYGTLDVTSQDDIYDRGLLSRIIRPDAYYELITLGKSIHIQDEKIGNLAYLSCYVPLRDDMGATLGYINVPFFSSEKDLNFQISNIVVTLINLYAFIFLISSLFTVIITRWLTRTLNIIIRQFGRVNLQRNERIEWPYNDEIGMLVKEYNKMVRTVEENAIRLAQNERETAWREMARQVAHEIKNPLTPMKLNIQYLQQAMQNNHPNIEDLTNRVTASIIEQIDNLSYIASEFSNFAKMPEARPEELELNSLLAKNTELYLNEQKIKVCLTTEQESLWVFADRSQLVRVFTNLLENAIQAIPEDVSGIINVQLKKEDGNALITITDNGTGMTDDVVKKIFQPYFTTKSSGTGLGLAMTHKIIEFWKGQIWFETEYGVGTTFFIRLPLINNADIL
ncbi:MAG: ATP-binding protein [Flavipsychrobacter sp.]|nr:ATP-binding protein [Flavipsychrobacter sp.]